MLRKRLRVLSLFVLSSSFAAIAQEGIAGNCSQVEEIESFVTSDVAPTGSQCERFTGLNSAVGVSCFWVRPFRSAEADQLFEQIWADVTGCRNGETSFGQKGVNHPDSYQQRDLLTDNGIYRVAKKDKGQERRTLIFLSFEQFGS